MKSCAFGVYFDRIRVGGRQILRKKISFFKQMQKRRIRANWASVCRALFWRAGASELDPRPDKKTIMTIINCGFSLTRGCY